MNPWIMAADPEQAGGLCESAAEMSAVHSENNEDKAVRSSW